MSGNNHNRKRDLRFFVSGAACVVIALLVIYLIIRLVPMKAETPGSIAAFKKISEAERIIDRRFTGEEDKQLMTDYMFVGMVAALGDKYSSYYTEEEYEQISKTQDGYYEGIGVTVGRGDDDQVVILEVYAGGPADKAGIKADDVITKLNGAEVDGMEISEIVSIIRTSEDPEILLGIVRGEEDEMQITVRREDVKVESAAGEMIEGTQTGHIVISYFTGLVPEQFKKIYKELEDQGMKSLIIDLRGNPGGLVTSVCDTLKQILPKGNIFYMTDKQGKRKEYNCDGKYEIDIPLAVLVNGESASASEIFAGAVQDHKVGTIVGTQTYGKGIVQDVYRLSDGSVLKLTVAHYYTPGGNDIHEKGITPDVEASDDENTEEDEQLEAALELFR